MSVTTRHPLHDAIIRAIIAADSVSVTLANGTEQEADAAEDAAWEAKNALVLEFRKLGIGEDRLRQLGRIF